MQDNWEKIIQGQLLYFSWSENLTYKFLAVLRMTLRRTVERILEMGGWKKQAA